MYRVRVTFTGGSGVPWLATHYFREAGGTAQQAATAVGTFWGAVDAFINSGTDWTTEADVSLIDDATGQLTGVQSTTPVTGTGGSAVERLPQQDQILVRWRTGSTVNGRELRGRTFIPGVIEDTNDAGDVLAATRATILTAAQALITDANSVLLTWHRPTSPGAADGSEAIVTTASVWQRFAVLRSRRD